MLLPLVPLRSFGRRFFVLMSLVAVAFVGVAVLDRGLDVDPFHFAAAGLLIAYNVFLPQQPGVDPTSDRAAREEDVLGTRLARLASTLLLAAAIACGGCGIVRDALVAPTCFPDLRAGGASLVAGALAASFLLGATIVSMVLGHWYLVSRKLSFAPLRRTTVALGLALAARVVVGGIAVWAQWGEWAAMVPAGDWTRFLLTEGVFLAPRLLFGLIVPLVLVRMAWKCVQIEANQSATGILYVIVAFVLIGEILAKYFLVSERHLVI